MLNKRILVVFFFVGAVCGESVVAVVCSASAPKQTDRQTNETVCEMHTSRQHFFTVVAGFALWLMCANTRFRRRKKTWRQSKIQSFINSVPVSYELQSWSVAAMITTIRQLGNISKAETVCGVIALHKVTDSAYLAGTHLNTTAASTATISSSSSNTGTRISPQDPIYCNAPSCNSLVRALVIFVPSQFQCSLVSAAMFCYCGNSLHT